MSAVLTTSAACRSVSPGSTEASCGRPAGTMATNCMPATFAVSCPADNFAARNPDITTTNVATCQPCAMTVSDDMNPASGEVWFSVDFGPLQKDDGTIYDTDLTHYVLRLTDQYGRLLPSSWTAGMQLQTVPRGSAASTTCCEQTRYHGTVMGVLNSQVTSVKVTILPYSASQGGALPMGRVSGLKSDSTSGYKKMA